MKRLGSEGVGSRIGRRADGSVVAATPGVARGTPGVAGADGRRDERGQV